MGALATYAVNPVVPTFADLQARVRAERDPNLDTVLRFVLETLGAGLSDNLDDFMKTGARATAFAMVVHALAARWPGKSTQSAHRSRVKTVFRLAEEVLEDFALSPETPFLRAVSIIQSKIFEKYNSIYAFEVKAFGQNTNFVDYLLKKTSKYEAGRSKQAREKISKICDELGLDSATYIQVMVDEAAPKRVKTRLHPSSFEYGLPQDVWPAALRSSLQEIVDFHKSRTPGVALDGTAKVRLRKSHWKTRASDGVCHSENTATDLFKSFFGYCTLPRDVADAREMVLARLRTTSVAWEEADLPMYDSWLVGEGLKPEDATIGWLLDLSLVERWLDWLAARNGGISRTQPTYCMVLRAWTNPKAGVIAQSYSIASQVLGFQPLPPKILNKSERSSYHENMLQWRDYCNSVSSQFLLFREAYDSPKEKTKPLRVRKHDDILSLPDPMAPIRLMVLRYHKLEPTHLHEDSASWQIWVRNRTILEVLISNPLRSDNIRAMVEGRPNGEGNLFAAGDVYELRYAKHEVKNPHKEKKDGYRAPMGKAASGWMRFYLKNVRSSWFGGEKSPDRIFLSRTGRALLAEDLNRVLHSICERCLPEYEPINTHLFRHLIATSWLKSHPDDFITVALMLGDRIETVIRDYAHLATQDGVRRYHAEIDVGRPQPPSEGGE